MKRTVKKRCRSGGELNGFKVLIQSRTNEVEY